MSGDTDTLNLIRNGLSTGRINAVSTATVAAPPRTYRPAPSIQKIQDKLDTYQRIESLRFPIDQPKYYISMKISEYRRTSLMKLGLLNPLEYINLPLPLHMVDAHGVDYETAELGTLVGTVFEGIAGTLGAGRPDSPDKQGLVTVPDRLGGVAVGVAGFKLNNNKLVRATGAVDVAKAFGGFSPNAFLTILLKGPIYKTYTMNWVLSPRNEQESVIIRKMINHLNNHMAPALAMGGAIFQFPNVFELAFWPNSQALYKFKPAVLRNMQVNYAGSGQPAFYRQSIESENLEHPESVQIALDFMELEYWVRGDFIDNNNPYDRN